MEVWVLGINGSQWQLRERRKKSECAADVSSWSSGEQRLTGPPYSALASLVASAPPELANMEGRSSRQVTLGGEKQSKISESYPNKIWGNQIISRGNVKKD